MDDATYAKEHKGEVLNSVHLAKMVPETFGIEPHVITRAIERGMAAPFRNDADDRTILNDLLDWAANPFHYLNQVINRQNIRSDVVKPRVNLCIEVTKSGNLSVRWYPHCVSRGSNGLVDLSDTDYTSFSPYQLSFSRPDHEILYVRGFKEYCCGDIATDRKVVYYQRRAIRDLAWSVLKSLIGTLNLHCDLRIIKGLSVVRSEIKANRYDSENYYIKDFDFHHSIHWQKRLDDMWVKHFEEVTGFSREVYTEACKGDVRPATIATRLKKKGYDVTERDVLRIIARDESLEANKKFVEEYE